MSDAQDEILLPVPYDEAYEASGFLASGEPQTGTKLKIDGIKCKLLDDGQLMYGGINCTPLEQFRDPVWDPQFDRDGIPEPDHWFNLCNNFRLLGRARKLLTLYRMDREERGENSKIYDGPRAKGYVKIVRAPGMWEAMYVKWRWKYRCEAWDAYVSRQIEDKYIERQVAIREEEWKKSGKLMAKAGEMLDFPLEEEIIIKEVEVDGKMVTQEIHRIPMRWTLRDAAAFVKVASEIGRRSTGDVSAEVKRVANVDMREFTVEELEMVINGADPIRILADKISSGS